MSNWKETFRLINKTTATVTPITINGDATGSMLPWRESVAVTSTGIKKTNGGTIILRIDNIGTFVRSTPILNDQNAKAAYLIEYQISQDINGTGIYTPGKLFRMEIRNAVTELVDDLGECLNLTCIELQYRLKESFDSKQYYFATPQEVATHRIADYDQIYGNIVLNINTSLGVNFPNDTSLKNNWVPLAPTSCHDLLSTVITTLAQPPTAGGTLTDYYFDFDPDPTTTKKVTFISGIFGATDSGVTITPTSTTPVGVQTSQSNTLRNQNYKNQVILKANSTAGSLPGETVRFNSAYTHANGYDGVGGRPVWSNSVSYNVNDLVQVQLAVTDQFNNTFNISRYFTAVANNSNVNPISDGGSNWYEDFTIIPEWTPDSHYDEGSFATVTSGTSVNFYMSYARISMTNSNSPATPPNPWQSIWNTKPTVSYAPFYSYTPWTSNLSDFLTNISFESYSSTKINNQNNPNPYDYIGFFVDWNFVRANYDPKTRIDPFSYITLKWATYYRSTPPSDPNEIFGGQRILVKSPGTGLFSGHDNEIAQYDLSILGWHFSNTATVNDIVSVTENGAMLQFNGTSWVNIYDANTNQYSNKILTFINNSISATSPFHLIKDIYLTTGASGIAAQAIEARFEYNTPTLLTGISNSRVFVDARNLTSRGLWMNFWFPYPRFASGTSPVGYRYGQNIGNTAKALGTLNTYNLDGDRHGNIGWNNGINSEDMGQITGVHFKLKPSFYRIDQLNNNSILTQGYDNQTFQFWAVDMFDRVFYQEFQCRVNGSYETIDIQFGANAQQLLYFNRVNDLITWGGFTSPWNFFLKEKEFTGVSFDWRFVKVCGWQWKGANDETGQYKLMIEQQFAEYVSQGAQIANSLGLSIVLGAFNVNNELDYGTIALDEFYFIKELYANSTDAVMNDPRTDLQYDESETDYYNAKTKAQAISLRDQYYPLFTTYEATGDVRLRFGQSFTVSGTRVPNGTDTQVCSEVTHTVDKNGYNILATSVKKFVLPTLAVSPKFGNGTNISLPITTFTITGSSFTPHGTVNFLLDTIPEGPFIADGSGNFSASLTSGIAGVHTVTATDATTGISCVTTFTVT